MDADIELEYYCKEAKTNITTKARMVAYLDSSTPQKASSFSNYAEAAGF